jgi:hypothetical protein
LQWSAWTGWHKTQARTLRGRRLSDPIALEGTWDRICVPRLGVATLTRLAFQGSDFFPLSTEPRLLSKSLSGRPGAGAKRKKRPFFRALSRHGAYGKQGNMPGFQRTRFPRAGKISILAECS